MPEPESTTLSPLATGDSFSTAVRKIRSPAITGEEWPGGTAVFRSSPLQRCFRDVHTITQHAMVGPATLELTGGLLLGQELPTFTL